MTDDPLDRLKELTSKAEAGGGSEKVAEQHRKGKLTARERLEKLLDLGSFVEMDQFVTHRSSHFDMPEKRPLGDGVVTGYGRIGGRLVYVFSHDFTVLGGSLGEMFGKKVTKVMDLAMKTGAPLIGLTDSGGARIQEGVVSLAAYSEIFFRNTLASGVIPQISAVLGPAAGGAVYSPALTDIVIMVKGTSNMFITGPDVVKAALGQDVGFEELGGAQVHASKSGVAHFLAQDEMQCFDMIRQTLSYLPQNSSERPPQAEATDPADRVEPSLREMVPKEANSAYDIIPLIRKIVDDGEYMEVHQQWAPNITVGFARMGGSPVGVVANQPNHLSGALDVDCSVKAARFVRLCDCFNLPVVTFVDVPGYMPGTDQEHGGIIRQGAKLLYAYCEATVPKVTVIVRKAYGGAYCAMGSKYSRADMNFAWPNAEIAVMGPEAAVNLIFRRELAGSKDGGRKKAARVREYREKFANPYEAASRGIVDAVIDPADTRVRVISALRALEGKSEFRPQKKHGNIPL